ncbi:SlyX family protein [Neorhizobium huautlense]|uniref:SlyX family protein n=1 Tax=Neorhizobium huautlense TaxID=67774 RepID=UPI0027D81778|nr:SlyX family protein [Neorhizobium huautlense]
MTRTQRQKRKSAVSNEDRLIKLEELAAHQAKVIEELSDQLAEQWKVVEQTRAKLDRLTERFLSLEETTLDAPAITRPPHY